MKRWFSCPQRPKELLQKIRPEDFGPDDLVFPSPTGKAMVESNFSDRTWSKILEKVGLASKDGIKWIDPEGPIAGEVRMVQLCLGGNFHTNLRVPFYQGLSLPPFQILSVNQLD